MNFGLEIRPVLYRYTGFYLANVLGNDILSCKYRKVVPFDVSANSFRRSERPADNIDSIVLDMIAL